MEWPRFCWRSESGDSGRIKTKMIAVCPLVNEINREGSKRVSAKKNMKLKDINGLRDLEHYGISVLTGERDNLLLGRLLCDLNEDGAKLLQDYFGLAHRAEFVFQSNWNRTVGDKTAIHSIMLTAEALWDIAVFAFLQAGAKFCYRDDHNGRIFADEGEIWSRIDESYNKARADWEAGGVVAGTWAKFYEENVPDYLRSWKRYRNLGANFQVHAMSGRS